MVALTALALLYRWLYGRNADPPRTTAPSGPTIVEQAPSEDEKDAPPAEPAKPHEAGLSDKRRRYVLDGSMTAVLTVCCGGLAEPDFLRDRAGMERFLHRQPRMAREDTLKKAS